MPPTSQLDWLSSTTAMIVLFWSRATRDLLKSFGWGIAALHRLDAATKLPRPRRPPHSISQFLDEVEQFYTAPASQLLFGELAERGRHRAGSSQRDRGVTDGVPSEAIADLVDGAVDHQTRHALFGAGTVRLVRKSERELQLQC